MHVWFGQIQCINPSPGLTLHPRLLPPFTQTDPTSLSYPRVNSGLRTMYCLLILTWFFFIPGGALSNSLALFTDVLHLASDLTSFIISVLAIYLSGKPATKRMSFGYHRAGKKN